MVYANYTSSEEKDKEDQMKYVAFVYFICGSVISQWIQALVGQDFT